MTDTSKCFSLIRGRVMRITRLDGCGATVLGPDSVVISEGFVTIGLTAKTDTGNTISVTNAGGKVCILDEPCPEFTGYDLSIEFCGVNPDLIRLMTGQKMVTDQQTTPQGTGFRMNTDVVVCDTGFALEVWSSVPTENCVGGAVSYGYFLVPFIKGGIIGDFTIQNDAINFTLSGAASKNGSAWGVGPFNVVANSSGTATPLKDAIVTGDHLHMEITPIAPPSEVCGATALGVPATGATAGIPGSYTPTNSYGPLNLAGLSGVTASPLTAWTTGQYITLRDGSKAHWNSTAWVAGVA